MPLVCNHKQKKKKKRDVDKKDLPKTKKFRGRFLYFS